MAEETQSKLSFFSKTPTICPVCDAEVYREELRSGGGRLIAGELTPELRRKYEPSKKYGPVYPLIYPIMVCPVCYYAAFPKDFSEAPPEAVERLKGTTEQREQTIGYIFDDLAFNEPRTLKEGIAAYYFAMMCYDFFPAEFSPTIKRGLCALRAAWLSYDMHRAFPGDNYDYLGNIFYRKARFYYTLAVEYEQSGKEGMGTAANLGPDVDKNYGYDGVLFLAAYLEYAHGPSEDAEQRKKALENAKRTVARIFGMGRASKSKPTVILENAKELHHKIGEKLESLADGE
jgi:hypothetical protein